MGCWAAPYTVEKARAVEALMGRPLSGKIANDKLYFLVGDDGLADDIDDLVKKGESKDVRYTVITFLQSWFGKHGDDAELLESWGWSETFSPQALAVFKRMLTRWDRKIKRELTRRK